MICFLAVLIAVHTPAAESPVLAGLHDLDGTWSIVSVEAKGVVLANHPYRNGTMHFREGKLTIRGKDGVEVLNYKLDTAATPLAIDITGGTEKRYPLKGIAQRDGASLQICVTLPPWPLGRPGVFKSVARNKSELWTLKRVGP
jgi:uncharacterized protein (TIGR03067 family)